MATSNFSKKPFGSLQEDLEYICEKAREDLAVLNEKRLFITGATGFVGTWLLEAFNWSKSVIGIGPSVEILTRAPKKFFDRLPHLAESVEVTQGDVMDKIVPALSPDFIIHAATPASASLNESDPKLMFNTVVGGMKNILEMAGNADRPRLLFTSSGAVYGQQPPKLSHVSEKFMGGPNIMSFKSAYHEGKRAAELLGTIAFEKKEVDVITARMFAFVGPYLPIDTHFAIGNFIRDALQGGPITVGGDGTPMRSYQYASDLTIWLLALLVRGEPGNAYNVGSEKEISILDLANLVASEIGDSSVEVLGSPEVNKLPERYVPDCQRIKNELNLENSVDLSEAIRRTAGWHKK